MRKRRYRKLEFPVIHWKSTIRVCKIHGFVKEEDGNVATVLKSSNDEKEFVCRLNLIRIAKLLTGWRK